MTAKCKKCNREVVCPIVGDDQQKAFALGQQLLEHMSKYHLPYMKQLSQDTKIFSGFVVMNRFEIDDDNINNQTEDMRERLAEIIMEDGPLTSAEEKLEAIKEFINNLDEDENEEEEGDEEEVKEINKIEGEIENTIITDGEENVNKILVVK